MEKYPKNFFGKVWSIDAYGKITEPVVVEATREKITVTRSLNDGSSTYDTYLFHEKTGTWDCYHDELVFDLHSDYAQQLINDRITKRAQEIEKSHRDAFERYLKDMKEIVAIRESNLQYLK